MAPMSPAPREFAQIVSVLYGGLVDPDEIWSEVRKSSPDQADLHASSGLRRATEGVALGGTVAGGVLGVQDIRRTRTELKEAGKTVRSLAGAKRLAIPVTALGADALATAVLATNKPKKPKTLVPTGVTKAISMSTLPKLDDVVAGTRRLWGQAASAMKPAAAPAPGTPAGQQQIASRIVTRQAQNAGHATTQAQATQQAKSLESSTKAGKDVGNMLATTSGKVLAGGAALGAGMGLNRGRKKLQSTGGYIPPDDGTFSYGKSAEPVEFEATGTFSKLDDDKHLAFGWASVTKLNGSPIVDRQGDYIDTDDLEDAAYVYVHDSRVGGDMHRRDGDSPVKVSDLVESMVFTDDKVAKLGLPHDFPRGWWVGYKIHDDAAWEDVKKMRRKGFSIHGKGRRIDTDIDELMTS